MRFIDYGIDHRIILINYPPHSTHRLQPLDVGCFSPLASFCLTNLAEWIQQTQGLSRISKREFFKIFWPSFTKAMSEKNILSAFNKSGFVPFDPSMVLNKIPLNLSDIPDLQRPSSMTSDKSTLSESDIIKIRAMFSVALAENNDRMVRKQHNHMLSL